MRRGQFGTGPGNQPMPFSARRAQAAQAGSPTAASRAGTVPETPAGPASGPGPVLLRLQRQLGNRYVQRVVRQARETAAGGNSGNRGSDEIGEPVRAAIEARRGGGQRLDPATGAYAGRALGADFGHVRVHADTTADQLTRALNAEAFTTGSDIFFRAGQYRPATSAGQRLLAHELAHVQQQRAGVSPSPRLRLGPAGDKHEQAADQAARDISHGTAAPSSARLALPARTSQAGAPVRRKVYIEGNELAQPSQAKEARPGDQAVQAMITDDPKRYFDSEQELYDFAAGKTKTIGYLKEAPAWIRLSQDELLVLGENHSKITLKDVTHAVGADRWKYEQYSDLPDWLFAEDSKPRTDEAGRHRLWQQLDRQRRDGQGHEAENHAAKLWRGLAGFSLDAGEQPARTSRKMTDRMAQQQARLAAEEVEVALETANSAIWELLEEAIFTASMAKKDVPELYQAYAKHKEVLDAALSLGHGQRQQWLSPASGPQAGHALEIKASIIALTNAVAGMAAKNRESLTSEQANRDIDKNWKPARDDYKSEPMQHAEKARDLFMYQHILDAANNGDLLFGFGRLHGERLEKVLEQQQVSQRKIRYLTMAAFIAEQLRLYPQ